MPTLTILLNQSLDQCSQIGFLIALSTQILCNIVELMILRRRQKMNKVSIKDANVFVDASLQYRDSMFIDGSRVATDEKSIIF